MARVLQAVTSSRGMDGRHQESDEDSCFRDICAGPTPDFASPTSASFQSSRDTQAVDTPVSSDATASFSADHWAENMPHGYATARKRVMSTYDNDVLELLKELSQLEDDHARGLKRLCDRVQRKQADVAPDVNSAPFAFGQPTKRPIAQSLQYSSAQMAWRSVQDALCSQTRAHRLLADDLRSAVIGPLKASVCP